MENVFFNDEVLAAEKKIITYLKIPSIILMENAGAGSAEYILNNHLKDHEQEVIIVCGKGNNAGDGFVTARHLSSAGVRVKAITLFREIDLKGDALVNYNILKKISDGKISIVFCKDGKNFLKEISSENKIIIDAIFGIGFKGAPDERMRSVFESINSVSLKEKTVISLDCPSGFYSYEQKTECIIADVTLMMGVRKFHSLFYKGREISGEVRIINIGISADEFKKYNSRKIFRTDQNDVSGMLTCRRINSYKYSNGKVFILAGSPGLTGAAYLCSMSAMRSGAGAVITGIPESLNDIMEIKLTEVMTLPLAETENKSFSLLSYQKITEKLKWADSVLIGPGLSGDSETQELVRKIIRENDNNFVLDADAIQAFRNDPGLLKNKKIIITPHLGEFAKLTGKTTDEIRENFYELVTEFVKKYKVTVVLKNSPSIIADESGFYINSAGRENLATAGSGDVLSGIIAGLLSQNHDLRKSAIAGAFLHGLCGDKLYEESGDSGITAGDLINEISDVKNGIRNA